MYPTHTSQSGQLLVLVLVFGSVFLVIISSFIGNVVSQAQVVDVRFEQQRATEIAEAGLNYYKWYLSHFPGDTSGDGSTTVFTDFDSGEPIGEFQLAIASSSYCGQIATLDVTSTGYTYANPDAQAIITSSYKRPTVAEYSFITNSGVWFGGGTVLGPLHSNQGLRMEAAHNSSIGSGQATWDCDSSYGCSPTVVDAPGVYTDGTGSSNPGLFEYPVSPIDFAGLTLDLNDMKTQAQTGGGLYYGPTSNYGYMVTLNGNSTVTVREVTNTYAYWSYDSAQGWHTSERNVITALGSPTTTTIDDACPLLYFEDKVWLQGDVNQKVTVAAADLASSAETNVVINGNIEYVSGSDAGLLVLAEDDVDINLEINEQHGVSSENLTLHGIYIAQNGRFGRNYYSTGYLSSAYDPFVRLDSLTQLGTTVSNERAVTNWVNGSGSVLSGFEGSGGSSSFDRDQVDDPPPLTPETSDVYQLQDWRQES